MITNFDSQKELDLEMELCFVVADRQMYSNLVLNGNLSNAKVRSGCRPCCYVHTAEILRAVTRSDNASIVCCQAGDLLAALLLARLHQTPDDLKTAVELALASLQHIVLKTYEASSGHQAECTSLPEVTANFSVDLLTPKGSMMITDRFPIDLPASGSFGTLQSCQTQKQSTRLDLQCCCR